ncbi:MAG: YnbE family lipoprotein [Candidatus Phaeomarinobacter sp.]
MNKARNKADARSTANSRPAMAYAVPLCAVLLGLSVSACTPTVKVQAPDKPIEINLNVKIEQEIRIKVDRELDDLFANNPDLF